MADSTHSIRDDTKTALYNWGRFCRHDGSENLGYPRVQPMFRDVRNRSDGSEDNSPPAVNDEMAAAIEVIIRRSCSDPVERCALWMYWVERLPTWEKIAESINEATACHPPLNRHTAREATQRAECRIDAAWSAWSGFRESA